MSEESNLETHEEVQKSPGALLADDFYATDKPKEVAEEAAPEPQPEPEKEEQQEEVKVAEEADDAVEPTSLEQLAEHLETDPEWFEGLTVKQKVNGKEVEVRLADALSTHRKVAAADDYLSDAKQKAKATIEQAESQKQQIIAAAAVINDILKSQEEELDAETNGINWDKLRREDPAEYSAKKEELRERRGKLQEKKLQAAQAVQQQTVAYYQQQQQFREKDLPNQQNILLERVPEWSDPEVAQREQSELVSYLTADGYSQEDINIAAYNGKLLSLAVKAMRYDHSKGKVEAAKKKVVKIPKVMKPGKPSESSKPTGDKDDRVSILYGSET